MNELRIEAPVVVAGMTLVSVARVRLWKDVAGLYATKEPAAVVLCGRDGCKAFDPVAGEIPLAQLLQQVPGLDGILKRIADIGEAGD